MVLAGNPLRIARRRASDRAVTRLMDSYVGSSANAKRKRLCSDSGTSQATARPQQTRPSHLLDDPSQNQIEDRVGVVPEHFPPHECDVGLAVSSIYRQPGLR